MEAVDFLRRIRPYLILKADEADLALTWRKFTGVKSKGMPAELRAERLSIRDGLVAIRASRKKEAEDAHQALVSREYIQ